MTLVQYRFIIDIRNYYVITLPGRGPMNACVYKAMIVTILGCCFSTASLTTEMTGGVYRIELSTFDSGGALSTGSVYWHYSALGQTEGVGNLTELSGSTYAMGIGVLPQPIPEPLTVVLSGIIIVYLYTIRHISGSD